MEKIWKERRKSRRVRILQDIILGNRSLSRGWDIGEEGMFILTQEPFMVGSIIDISFRLFNGEKPVYVQAEVIYIQEGVGMGVHFRQISQEDKERIRRFINRVAGDQSIP